MRYLARVTGMAIPLLAIIVGLAIYIYRFVRRIAAQLNIPLQKRWQRALLLLPTAILIWFSVNIFSVSAIGLLHFWLISMLIDLVNWLIKKIRKKEPWNLWKALHRYCVLPIVLTAAIIGFGYYNMRNVQQTNFTVSTDKELRAQGYRVALIADLHCGVTLSQEELQEICDEISAQHIDRLCLVGDITDESTSKAEMEAAYAAFGSVETSLGVYFSYGNHDRQLYSRNPAFTPDELAAAIEANGITILQDRVLAITEDLTLIGREDAGMWQGTRKPLEELLAAADPTDFCLVLDHQPKEYDEHARLGTDLLLSGHTHAGQIWPANWVSDWAGIHDNVYGMVTIEDFTGIVTSGIAGWNFPIKTSAPSEYVIIDIQK